MIGNDLRSHSCDVFVVGSFVTQPKACNDFDVLVIVSEEYCRYITKCFRKIKKDFMGRFNIPLHYLIITEAEFNIENKVVANMLDKPHEKIF